MTPLVSVITPCYRQGHFLPHALDSVLTQSVGDLEMIVVDDGSPDDTSRVAMRYMARDPRVRYVVQPNRGLAGARNAGLALATGAFVVCLDADDQLLPDALRTGIASLEQDPAAVYTRGRFEVIDRDGRLIGHCADTQSASDDEYELLLRDNPIWLPAAVMFRRAAFDSITPFDSRADAAADLELYLRLARVHRVTRHAGMVAQYRRHGHNMSMNPTVMAPAILKVLEAQRQYTERNVRWRAAQRYAIREWESRHLIPMMRKAVRDLVHGSPQAMTTGFKLIAGRGPGAVAHALVRRVRSPGGRSTNRELGPASGAA